jgi:transcriptional regulator with XRE-family HTH domain
LKKTYVPYSKENNELMTDILPEKLQIYQNENGLTQHEMAEILGVSQASYNNWINRHTVISPKYYPIIAQLCKIDLTTLIPFQALKNDPTGTTVLENNIILNTLELYEKFSKLLEEQNLLLKMEVERLKGALKERGDEKNLFK